MFRSADGSTVVVPGKPDESELLLRITSDDPEAIMPPPRSGKSMSPAQAALVRRWIEQGAVWKGHWSFIPAARPASPTTVGAVAIDRFLRARMEAVGLSPSPEADRPTLIRRLSLDLIGLPPTPEEVDAFARDDRPDAYERLVNRLLASPHYGERMAIFWLDLVRFADTQGYHSDNHVNIWMFRDYVIRAFNANKPFDRFTIEQLAGDLLPKPTDETRIASGYNRLLQTTQEGGAQPKEYIAKYAADRVRNVSTVWMGVTMGCAECHDHKYDPFTTREFYSLSAFFADVKETIVGAQEPTRFPDPEQAAALRRIQDRRTALGIGQESDARPEEGAGRARPPVQGPERPHPQHADHDGHAAEGGARAAPGQLDGRLGAGGDTRRAGLAADDGRAATVGRRGSTWRAGWSPATTRWSPG